MDKSTVVNTYKVMDISFSHTECEFDETEFDVTADLDETDTITEVMNLFADFIAENNYTDVHNINVYTKGIINVHSFYEDGKFVGSIEEELKGDLE